jgi:hypothetical protein
MPNALHASPACQDQRQELPRRVWASLKQLVHVLASSLILQWIFSLSPLDIGLACTSKAPWQSFGREEGTNQQVSHKIATNVE